MTLAQMLSMKMHEVVEIAAIDHKRIGYQSTYMRVPGGWLYQTNYYQTHDGACSDAITQTFVPEPKGVEV